MASVRIYLDELLGRSPHLPTLSLSKRAIADLAPIVRHIASFKHLQELDLEGNRLTRLPADLSSLSSITTLNIAGNPFSGVEAVAPGLASLINLKHLRITLKSGEDDRLKAFLPRLATLNGIAVSDEDNVSVAPSVREVSLTEGDLEAVAVLFGGIKSVRGPTTPADDLKLTQTFDAHVRSVMAKLKDRLEGMTDPFLRQSEIVMAKMQLFDVCFTESIDQAGSYSKEFAMILRKLRTVHLSLFDELPHIVADASQYHAAKSASYKAEAARVREDCAKLSASIKTLQTELSNAIADRDEALLQLEAASVTAPSTVKALSKPVSPFAKPPLAQPPVSPRRSASGTSPLGGLSAITESGSVSLSADLAGDDGYSMASSATVKHLSLNQLKEVIEAIYASKDKFDKKCNDAGLPRETMEQHMYTYLNQKYGLKALIIEHASAIVKATNKFAAADNDVAVFLRILRNEIDEGFRVVQSQLKQSIQELLGIYLKGKFPLKPDDAVRDMLNERLQGYVFEEEWVDIIKYLYNQEDALTLIVAVRDVITSGDKGSRSSRGSSAGVNRSHETSKKLEDGKRGGPRGRILYQHFVQVLLDFQLKNHERYLTRFRSLFRSIDTDGDGIVSVDEFHRLVYALGPHIGDDAVEGYTAAADPHLNNHISFTDCVLALSPELSALNASK